jgi:neutral ceramidase
VRRPASAPGPEAEPCLRAGAAAVSITPEAGTGLQGYGVRIAEGVDEALISSALVIGSDEIDWLLISLDLIGIDRTFTARIREALAKRLAVRPERITLACSHTHSGPPSLPRLGPVTSDEAYLDLLEARVLEVAQRAAACRRPVTLRIGVAEVLENINRRERKNGRIELGADPDGPVDHRVWVGRFDALGGSVDAPMAPMAPMAIVVKYACHATCSAESSNISSDWPGVMRRTVQHLYERDGMRPVICFVQGCAGDVTHRIGRDPRSWPEHFGAATSLQASIMGRLVATGAIAASERAEPARAARVFVTSTPIALPFRDVSGSERTELQVVRIGASLPADVSPSRAPSTWFLFLPGEPLAAYGDALSRAFTARFGARPNDVVVCGYANDAVGYLCTPQALREGGYEAADAHRVYHRPAAFAETTLSVILRACTVAAARLGHAPGRWRPAAVMVRSLVETIRSFLTRRYSRISSAGPLA